MQESDIENGGESYVASSPTKLMTDQELFRYLLTPPGIASIFMGLIATALLCFYCIICIITGGKPDDFFK